MDWIRFKSATYSLDSLGLNPMPVIEAAEARKREMGEATTLDSFARIFEADMAAPEIEEAARLRRVGFDPDTMEATAKDCLRAINAFALNNTFFTNFSGISFEVFVETVKRISADVVRDIPPSRACTEFIDISGEDENAVELEALALTHAPVPFNW